VFADGGAFGGSDERRRPKQEGCDVRLALLGFSHETNTFVRQPTSYDRFVQSGILRGEEVVQRHRHAHSTIAGYLEAADRFGCTVAPLYFAATEPAGMSLRGVACRGVANASGNPLKYGNPGVKPMQLT